MAKLISMIVVFCLIFSLTACGVGSGANGNAESSPIRSQTEAPSSETVEEPNASAA